MAQADAPYAVVFETDLGWMGVAYSPAGVMAITLPRASEEAAQRALWDACPQALPGAPEEAPDDIVSQLRRYAAGERVTFHVTLDWSRYTPFQQAVWQATQRIPYGETRSYGWIAQAIGRPRAARAVGQALGANPTPIVVPCHRVVTSDGRLGGFGGGLDLKRRLLALEGVHL
jgi:O-6-methylguanine DNA methyltransferase